ncbi:MAG: type I secretion protein, partial [Pseudomonadota bacterium]
MARISELHYSNAFARESGVEEFLEVALTPGDDPGDFTVSFYNADGSVGIEIPLDHPDVQFSIDAENGEYIYVVSAEDFPIQLTDPDGSSSNNYEAFSLTDTSGPTPDVLDFYDIGGGTQNILATDGLAAG